MSNLRPESRIKSLENRATDIEAKIEEMSADTAENLNALFTHVQKGFSQAHAYIQENIETALTDHTKRLDRLESKIDEILKLLQQKSGE